MEIFFRLLFGHMLADFTLQTNYIARWKRSKMSILLLHVVIHPVCYVALLWPYLGDIWVSPGGVPIHGWTAVLITGILHFLEDWFRVTMVNRGWRDNTVFYVWDQVVHIAVIWLLAPTSSQPVVTLWPLLGILFVVVTHFATVTAWFLEKDFFGGDYPDTDEKYVTILQRLLVWVAFFLPFPWWFIVPTVVLVGFGRMVLLRRLDFSVTAFVISNLIAVGAGIFTRFGLGAHL